MSCSVDVSGIVGAAAFLGSTIALTVAGCPAALDKDRNSAKSSSPNLKDLKVFTLTPCFCNLTSLVLLVASMHSNPYPDRRKEA